MRILIAGACGFVGSTIAKTWREHGASHEIVGIDNLARPGSEINRAALRSLGVSVLHRDIRSDSDFETLPPADWVIDAAANPSVVAGVDGRTSSRQLVEHNLLGTVNMLEYCRRHGAGFILLSTSRVYSIRELAAIAIHEVDGAFAPCANQHIEGLTTGGVTEAFSTEPPLSLYGATKIASERLALEYAHAFDFPVRVNRCGVLAGAGQFGRADQGIFSYWIHSWMRQRDLTYIGFNGTGHQVRDCLHPRDLVPLLDTQMASAANGPGVINVSGGVDSACSLRQVSEWCADRFGRRAVAAAAHSRSFDIPWLVLDSTTARRSWGWSPTTTRLEIFEEIARHAQQHPHWLDLTDD